MNIEKKRIKQFLIDAAGSFLYWTAVLTPYMLLIVKTDSQQYWKWVMMQAILVPPLGAIFLIIVRKIKK